MSFFQKKGTAELTNIDEIIISTVGGDFEIEGVDSPSDIIAWDAIWERETSDVEVVRSERKLIVRFDDKSNIVKFLGITISTSFGNLYKAKIKIPKNTLEKLSVNTVSGAINLDDIEVEKLKITSTSGDLFNENSTTSALLISTKSGDIKAMNIVNERKASFTTISGDVGINTIKTGEIICTSKSGDIKIENVSKKTKTISGNSVSGDIAVKNIPANAKLTTISGDIMIKNINKKASWETKTVSGDVNILTSPLDVEIEFNSVSGDAIFKKRDPVKKGKGYYLFGEGNEGKISAKTVSGDFVMKTDNYGVRNEHVTDEIPKEEKAKHDPDAERIVFTCSQGIITEDEAKEMLKILEYSDEAINKFMEDLCDLKKQNQKNEEENINEPEIIEEIYDLGKIKHTSKLSVDLNISDENKEKPYIFKKTIKKDAVIDIVVDTDKEQK
jgi:DUF4097 and DUF4098 domain-containing protein YvlB